MSTQIESTAQLKEFLQRAKNQGECAIDTEYIPKPNFKPQLLGISFTITIVDGTVFLPMKELTPYIIDSYVYSIHKLLDEFFYDSSIKKIFHNAKADLQCLWSNGFKDINNVYFDTQVAAWVLNPIQKRYALKHLVKAIYGVEMVDLSHYFDDHTFKDYYNADLVKAIDYACADAMHTFSLYKYFKPSIDDKYKKVFYDIEMPVIPTLARMEMHGIRIDRDRLAGLKNDFNHAIQALEITLRAIGTPIMREEQCPSRSPVC